jgi:hypothetical protein
MPSDRHELPLPPRFFDDHLDRGCEDGLPEEERSVIVSASDKRVIASMTDAGIRELWSDADYYASEMGAEGYIGLASSARATLRAIRAGYEPAAGWRLDPRIGL